MALLALLPITVLLTIVTKNKTEYILFPLIVLITTILMFFGFGGNITIGVYLVVIIAIAAFIADIFLIIRQGRRWGKNFLTPGCFAFVIGTVLLWVLCHGRQFIKADELVFAGPAVKYLFEYDSFAGKDMAFWDLNDTFPFIPLWCCYFMKLGSGFREDVCIFAKDIFILAGFISVFGITGKRHGFSDYAAALLIALLIPVMKIQETYSQLEYFGPQAAAVFYTLSLIINSGKKKAGIGTSFALLCGIIASCVVSRYGAFAAIPVFAAALLVSYKKRSIWILLALIVGCFISVMPGKFRFDINEISRLESWYPVIALGISLVLALIIICMEGLIRKGWVKVAILCIFILVIGTCYGMFCYVSSSDIELLKVMEWLNEYNKKIFDGIGEQEYLMGKYAVGVYDIFFLLASACASAFLYIRKKQKCDINPEKEKFDRTGLLITSAVYSGIFIYLVILSAIYVLYLRSEGEYKPIMAWYLFPAIALSCCSLISDLMMIKGRKRKYVLPASAVFVMMLAFTDPIGGIFDRPESENEISGIDNNPVKFEKEDRVFYIDTEMMETRDLPSEFKWKVFPAEYSSMSGIYYTPNPQDWSTEIVEPIECGELETLLKEKGITYVYLRKSSDFFFENYWPLFDRMGQYIDDDKLYKVTYDADGKMVLKVIGSEE